MFRRPRANETDEDLLKQEEELKARGAFVPAAKVVQANKRKTEDDQSAQKLPDKPEQEEEAPRSKFARDRAHKKKKEGIVDNTVLKEAVTKEKEVAVLGRVVERKVTPEDSLKEWHPEPNPQGFPQAMKLEGLNMLSSPAAQEGPQAIRKPSLYKQQLLKKGLINESGASSQNATAVSLEDSRINALGSKSCIVQDSSLLKKEDAKEIHDENISKISSMTHEERLQHQQDILSNLTPEQLNFLKSLRQAKEGAAKKGKDGKMDAQTSHKSMKEENQAMECLDSKTVEDDMEVNVDTSIPLNEGSSVPLPAKEKKKEVKFSEDVEMKEISSRDDEEELEMSGIPIPMSQAKKWINMSKVEVDKLKALTDMPTPKPLKNKDGFVARFDFEGSIMPYDKEVSHLEGLHHHGEEAGRPGYSLDEVFVFCRSQVIQQRHLGLRTLANIFRNAREGMYDTCVNPSIIQLAIEAGVILILRFAMDEPSELVYKEAVRALYYLIASEPDEQCLAMAQPWIPGGLEPGFSSQIYANNETRQELDSEEHELKDIEIIKLDVIRALIRMDTQSRLRYILGIIKPGPETVIHTIGILTRMARHSLSAAWKISETPHLIPTIVENFLPHNLSSLITGENVASMKSVYGVPLKHALHFLKVLAAKGRQLASVLVNTHGIMSQVLTYVSVEPSEVSMPLKEALMLSQEAYALWGTFLAYGLKKAQEALTSFYPMLVKQLLFYRDKVPINEEIDSNKFNYDVGAFLLNVLSRSVNVAASHSLLKNKMMLNQGTLVDANGKSIVLPPPLLTWDDMNDFPSLIETCLNKWLTQLSRSTEVSFSALRLIGSCCYFLECYYGKWKDQVSYSGDTFNAKIQHIYSSILSPFLKSPVFIRMIDNITTHSVLSCDLLSGTKRDPNNLGSLGCVTYGGKVVPVIQQTSPFPLLLPLLSFCAKLHSLHPSLDPKPTNVLLESKEFELYLSKFCSASHTLAGQWLTRIEVHFLCNVLQIAALKGCNSKQLFHEVAISVLPCIHRGDEILIKELLGSVICMPEFITDIAEVSTAVDDMALRDYIPLKSPAITQPVLSPLQLTDGICQSLKSIGSELINSLVSKREYDASVVLKHGIPFIINGITISQTSSQTILEKCWSLAPIKQVYILSQKASKMRSEMRDGVLESSSDQSSPEDILTITRCLQMTYLGLKYRRKYFLQEAVTLAWLQHLSLVFLVASDVFLDAKVSSYLQGCVVELLRNKGYANLEATNYLKGFNSCIAWFKEMLEQFKGVSYGDSTFALFLLIPLQQYWPLEFRMQLWSDMADALPFMFLSTEEVERFIPLEQFTEPEEEDEGLILKYRSILGSRTVSDRRNPFLYSIASHHVKHYLKKKANG